jgi:tetratricopeptide (TPR) repeat protein
MMRLVFFVTVLATFSIFGYQTPDSIKEKYSSLYSLKVESLPDGSRSFGEAKMFRRNGLYVLALKGDSFEMAFQHGKLLQQEILKGALPQVALIVDNTVKTSLPEIPFVTDFVIKYFYRTITDTMLQNGIRANGGDADRFMQDAYGLSEGSGMKLDDVIHAAYGPETLQVILGKQMAGKKLFKSETAFVTPINECTDFSVYGSYTKNGDYIIGRNTDYPLNGSFDRFPTVIYFQPTDGSQKYMAVSSAGLHMAGVVGYNESGLFLGVHTVPTLDVSEKGNPVFFVGQKVLKDAKTFDEAVHIFEQYKPAAGWTYTLVSAREKRHASIELSNHNLFVREDEGDLHVQTNHYVSPEMAAFNLDLNATINEDSKARRLRVEQMAEKKQGEIGVQEAVDILSDKWDPIHHEVRGLVNVVAVHTTLSSSVFDTARHKVYVADGWAPVSQSTYVEVPTIEEFNPDTFGSEPFSSFENKSYSINFPSLAQAEQLFIEAKIAHESELDTQKSSQILKQVVALDPSNAAYQFVSAIMALKNQDFSSAEASLAACEKLKYHHYQLLGHYYLGRIYADRGDKNQALKKLEQVLEGADMALEIPLIRATQAALDQVYNFGRLRFNTSNLPLFMAEADMLKYY